jgi:ABC-type spermidine/putrescine transport system permease subunit I
MASVAEDVGRGSVRAPARRRSALVPFTIRISPTVVFLIAFLLVPLGVLFAWSFGEATFLSQTLGHTLANYREGIETALYRNLLGRSLVIGAITGACCLVLAYPLAYAITLGPLRRRGDLVLFLVLVSLFSAYIVRVYAWRTLLGRNGVINTGLEWTGVISHPLQFLLYNRFAVVLTLVNVLIPLAVLPLYSALAGIDLQLLEAARNLGASPFRTFWGVTLPLSIRGVQAAFVLCFILAAGDYVTPQLVGGSSGQLLGNVIVSEFGLAFNWPLGSALSFLLIAAMAASAFGFVLLTRALGLRDRPR